MDCVITSVVGTNGQPLPLQGNTLGPTSKVVKKERHDEAEIQEMAAKMMEQQKAALLKQQQQTQAAQLAAVARQPGMLSGVNGQQYINSYFQQRGAAPPAANNIAQIPRNGQTNGNHGGGVSTSPSPEKPKPNDDEESQRGHFGWTTFGGKVHIPFILRQQEKYCAVRMTEQKLLIKYLGCLHPEIYSSCTCVRSYYITEAESRLLNEINHKHCDAQFGREMFSSKDLVVRLTDATKFYQFLDICYRKLISGSKTPSEKCGFIRINKESVVPYTVRNGEQVVPLFYFEGETENLRQKADNLSGWDLAYLKFCCKVQGIRNELFSSESVAVISLTDIKSYFPNGTEFEDYWPSKVVDSNLLLSPQRHNGNSSVNWTRQPTAPPPTKMNQPQQAKQQPQINQQQSNGPNARYNQQMQQNQVRNLHNAVTLEQFNQQFALGFMQPHQLLAAQAQVQQQNQRGYASSRNMQQMINAAAGRSYGNYNNGQIPMQQLPNQQTPPPLVRQNNQAQNAAMLNFTRLEQQQKRSLASNDPSSSSTKHSVNNPTNYPLSPMSSSSSTSSTPDLTTLSILMNSQAQKELLLGQLAKKIHQQQQAAPARDVKPHLPSLIPMNNSNVNKNSKFSMTKEMQEVVRKVLSNPDLSTFVQTNSSANFVPFMSPPVSPADSLTITPASPKPKSANQTNHNNSYNKLTDQMLRQKSVICSTSNIPSPATKQTLQSQSKYRSPMEVIDLSSSSPTPRLSTAYQQQLAAAQQRLQMQNAVSVHSVGGGGGRGGISNGNQGNTQNSAAMHLQRHAANIQQTSNGYGEQRLNVIPDVQNTIQAPPYKVQKVFVDNTTVPCINMKAHQDTDQLIALTDLREFLFPKASMDICKRSIEALRVEMYKGNRKQIQILMENNRIPNEQVPLVQVRDILKYMPQLRFMIQNQMDQQQQQQPLQKRARIS